MAASGRNGQRFASALKFVLEESAPEIGRQNSRMNSNRSGKRWFGGTPKLDLVPAGASTLAEWSILRIVQSTDYNS
jgi:hypothetical protein